MSAASDSGMSRQSKLTRPISTLICAVARRLGVEQPRRRLDDRVLRALLPHQQGGDAAGGVAARRHLAAVGVADAHEGVGQAAHRVLDDDQLVAADAGPPVGERPHLRDCRRERPRPRVDDDEVVAEAVHLGEREPCHAGP